MKRRRVPLGNRRWRDVTDFDLKIVSVVIVALSLISTTLFLYAVYLRFQKSRVEVVVREVPTSQFPGEERVVRTATETIVYVTPPTLEEPTPTRVEGGTATNADATVGPREQFGRAIAVGATPTTPSLETRGPTPATDRSTPTTLVAPATSPESTQTTAEAEEVNRYLRDVDKFDFSFLLSRMSEVLPPAKLYLYTTDGETALAIAKRTENYVIDVVGRSYHVAVPRNVMPHLGPTVGIFTVRTEPTQNSKEVFKSIVNLRALGLSAFSVQSERGYSLCVGVFKTESQAKSFYYSQDWVELSKYANLVGAKVAKVGE